MSETYYYYVHDHAAFRSKVAPPLARADDVFAKGEWIPYTGDPLEPIIFGSRVTEEVAKRLF